MSLSIHLFGTFRIARDGHPLPGVRLRDGDSLLAYLILRGDAVAKEQAAARLHKGSRESLKKCWQELKKNLGEDGCRLLVDADTLAFDVHGISCDVLEFDKLAEQGDEGSLERALQLYRAPLLEAWTAPVWETYRGARAGKRLTVLWRLATVRLQHGDRHEAARLLALYVEGRPDEERGWQRLISVLEEAGERMQAAAARDRYAAALAKRNRGVPPRWEPGSLADAGIEPLRLSGAMPLDSPYYVEREADEGVRRLLHWMPGILLIKGPRFTGKSSLLARCARQARANGCRVLFMDFAAFDGLALASFASLCRAIGTMLLQEGGIAPPSVEPGIPPGVILQQHVATLLAHEPTTRFIWAMDNVDRLFQYPCREEFFLLLRSWHNRRAFDPDEPWTRLCQIIACSMEARLYLRDLNQSPFNTGQKVDLADFTEEQVAELNRRYGNPLQNSAPQRFYRFVGGHPFLTQQGLYSLAVESTPLDTLFISWQEGQGAIGDHLKQLVSWIGTDPILEDAVTGCLAGKPCPEEAFLRLRSAGIMTGPHRLAYRFRCELYLAYMRSWLENTK